MTAAWRFDAIGTSWQVDTPVDLPDAARARVAGLVGRFDRTWSRFRPDATVARLRVAGSVDLGPDAPAILALYDRLDALTGGAVNPCVGASLERLGYDPVYSLTATGAPLAAVGWDVCHHDGSVLTVPEPVVLDIGAVGKGYLADQVADLVEKLTGDGCTVDASGDIVNRGGGPLRVALEHPHDPESAIGVVELPAGRALCGSARNRRAWGAGLHHVVDPRTGEPTTGVTATWAMCADAAVADGLSTALFFTEPAALADLDPAWGWVVLTDDGRLRTNLEGEFFT